MTITAKKTIALISGANTGIGLAVATQLAKDHGYHVIIGSRTASPGSEAAALLTADGSSASSVQLDITSDDSITAAITAIERDFGVLDVLINNAGVMLDHLPYSSTRSLFNQTLGPNLVGAACLTEACLPLLRTSANPRLLFVSSRMGSVSETTNKNTLYYHMEYRAYDSSKAALNILALNYARVLEGDGVLVNVVCPGLVATKLTGFHPMGSTVELGAQRIVEVATRVGEGSPVATFTDREGVIPW